MRSLGFVRARGKECLEKWGVRVVMVDRRTQ